MATQIWKGDAPAVSQVTGWTFGGTWEADDIVKVTMGGKTVSVTTGSTTISTIVDTVVTALNASTIPEFAEVTWSRSSNDLRGTADTAGVPFTATVTTTEANGGAADSQTIGSATAVTASSGPNDWSTAANWSTGSVPVNSDDVYLENSSSSILYGLDQSSVTLTSLNISSTFLGELGLAKENAGGYREYRDDYLKVSATTVNIGRGSGQGSGRLKINVGSNQTTVNIYGAAESVENGVPAILLLGTHASNAINLVKGSAAWAFFAGESSTVLTARVAYLNNVVGDSRLVFGAGCTLADLVLTQSGGVVEINAATSGSTVITLHDGELHLNSGNQIAPTIRGGVCYLNSTGTIGGNFIVAGTGQLNFNRDLRTKTISNAIDVYDRGNIQDHYKVAGSVVVDFNQGADPSLSDLGQNARFTRGAVA